MRLGYMFCVIVRKVCQTESSPRTNQTLVSQLGRPFLCLLSASNILKGILQPLSQFKTIERRYMLSRYDISIIVIHKVETHSHSHQRVLITRPLSGWHISSATFAKVIPSSFFFLSPEESPCICLAKSIINSSSNTHVEGSNVVATILRDLC